MTLSNRGMGGRHISSSINMYAVYCCLSPRHKEPEKRNDLKQRGARSVQAKQKYNTGKGKSNRQGIKESDSYTNKSCM